MKIQNIIKVWVLKRQKKHYQSCTGFLKCINPTGANFIFAPKICPTKQISKSLSNVFELVYFQIKNVYKNAKFLSYYNKLWILQNSDPIIQSLNNK